MLQELTFANLTCGMQAREHRIDRNQCFKPEISSVFNVVLNGTEIRVSICQSYSHYSRLNKLKT